MSGPRCALGLAAAGWVGFVIVLYLAPATDRAWWAIPFHAFDLFATFPAQMRPGPWLGARVAAAIGGLGATILVLGGATALGDLAVAALRVGGGRLRAAVALAAGSWVVSVFALACGAAGWLSPWPYVALLTGSMAAWITLHRRGLRMAIVRRREKPASGCGEKLASGCEKLASRRDRFVWVAMAAVGVAVVCQYVGALTPPFEYDALEYHLGAPAEWMRAGRIGWAPGNVYGNFPALTEMLFFVGLLLRSEASAKLIHFGFGLAAAGTVGAWAGRRWGRTPGWCAASIFLALPFTMQLATTARIDLATAFLGFTALAEAVDSHGIADPRGRGKAWARVAIVAGAACCTKYTAIVLVALPAALVTAVGAWDRALRPGRRVARSSAVAAGVGAGAVALLLPWLVKNAILTGNPVYPLFAEWLGGRDWSAAQTVLWRAKHLHPDLATALAELPRKLWIYSVVESGAVPVFLALLPLAALRPLRDRAAGAGRLAAGVTVMIFVWGIVTYAPWRFAYPAVGGACALAALAVEGWRARGPARTAARVGLAICLAWGVMIQVVLVGADLLRADRYPPRVSPLSWAAGRVARAEFLDPAAGPVLWMNEHLPPDALVLYVGEARTYYARRRIRANTVYDQSVIGTILADGPGPAEIERRLRAEGVTHIFVHGSELARLGRNYGYLDGISMDGFQRFLTDRAEIVYDQPPGRIVARLRPDLNPPPPAGGGAGPGVAL